MKNYLKVIAGSTNPGLAREICEYIDIQPGRIQIERGPNDNIKVKINENVREDDVFVIQTSAPPVNDSLVELLLIIDALKYASARRITAVLPYYPYVRSDKKDEPRISISARLVADLLRQAGADRILTMTLHSPDRGVFADSRGSVVGDPIVVQPFSENAGSEKRGGCIARCGQRRRGQCLCARA